MASSQGSGRLSYMPEPHERAYYEGLFLAADVQRTGSIGGAQAVQFFSKSGLPVDTLKNIWTVADQPPTQGLDRPKFAVAVRLIQLMQNGQKGQGANLAVPAGMTLRPVMFEGVSGVVVPMPPPSGPGGPTPQQQQPPQQQYQQPPPQQQQYQQTPPQQYQPPPPQQQQQPPPQLAPPMVQQAAMTPPRPPHPPQQPSRPPSSMGNPGMALTPQDPYTLTPQEQARYEAIFPEYAKDGFVYGQAAVTLFSKSGLSQQQLGAIWNMVDTPVDNRLDKLEFCMAMHLIVCISKKNLAMPPGLPLSLKQLKSQQSAATTSPPGGPMQAPPSPRPLSGMAPPSPGGRSTPLPMASSPPVQMSPVSTSYGPGSMASGPVSGGMQEGFGGSQQQGMGLSGMNQPMMNMVENDPRSLEGMGAQQMNMGGTNLQAGGSGGLSISDAFEGLSTADAGESYLSNPMPSMGFSETSMSPQQDTTRAVSPPMSSTNHYLSSPPTPEPVEMPKTTKQLASSYQMGEATEELGKLKAVLQKLQAENIALKARMGNMTEEESDIQKELSATIAEIGKLSSELTTLRAQMLASKSRLLEASAELKAAKEKKGVFKDLIAEANATKQAIDEAYEGIESANEAAKAQPAPTPSFDGDLFDFGAPAPLPSEDYSSGAPRQDQVDLKASTSYSLEPHTVTSADSQATEPTRENYSLGPTSNDTFAYGLGGHVRNPSSSASPFADGIMGGAPIPLSNMHDGPVSANSIQSVEELKKKAQEAEDVARDAEETRRQLVAQADELRRVADEAEKAARDHASAPEIKKKGFMGRGKKKDAKEGEKLAQEAKEKRDALLQVQSQVNDAQALAVETRREADRLRQEAEEAEMRYASVASMQQSQPSNGYSNLSHNSPNYENVKTETPAQWGNTKVPQWGDMNSDSDNFAGQSPASGFNSNIMGSGGLSIPTPSGNDDPYSNPFE